MQKLGELIARLPMGNKGCSTATFLSKYESFAILSKTKQMEDRFVSDDLIARATLYMYGTSMDWSTMLF